MTVTEAVGDILEEIAPGEVTLETIQQRRKAITETLEGNLKVSDIKPVGSHTRGTALRTSDADYLCVIARKHVTYRRQPSNSHRIMDRFVRLVKKRYDRTEIRKDGQAVTLDFADGGVVDLVPAAYEGTVSETDGYPVYRIPNGEGGWLRTSPEALTRYMKEADERWGGRLKAIARAVKSWRATAPEPTPLKGLWIELKLASSELVMEVGESRTKLLARVFRYLADGSFDAISDPSGASDPVPACRFLDRMLVQERLEAAADAAERANELEEGGNAQQARQAWRDLLIPKPGNATDG